MDAEKQPNAAPEAKRIELADVARAEAEVEITEEVLSKLKEKLVLYKEQKRQLVLLLKRALKEESARRQQATQQQPATPTTAVQAQGADAAGAAAPSSSSISAPAAAMGPGGMMSIPKKVRAAQQQQQPQPAAQAQPQQQAAAASSALGPGVGGGAGTVVTTTTTLLVHVPVPGIMPGGGPLPPVADAPTGAYASGNQPVAGLGLGGRTTTAYVPPFAHPHPHPSHTHTHPHPHSRDAPVVVRGTSTGTGTDTGAGSTLPGSSSRAAGAATPTVFPSSLAAAASAPSSSIPNNQTASGQGRFPRYSSGLSAGGDGGGLAGASSSRWSAPERGAPMTSSSHQQPPTQSSWRSGGPEPGVASTAWQRDEPQSQTSYHQQLTVQQPHGHHGHWDPSRGHEDSLRFDGSPASAPGRPAAGDGGSGSSGDPRWSDRRGKPNLGWQGDRHVGAGIRNSGDPTRQLGHGPLEPNPLMGPDASRGRQPSWRDDYDRRLSHSQGPPTSRWEEGATDSHQHRAPYHRGPGAGLGPGQLPQDFVPHQHQQHRR